MAEQPVSRQKRQGNYTPDRIKVVEKEIVEKYKSGQSAKSLGEEYGISKNTVLKIAERHGIARRGKAEAGALLRTVNYDLTPEELADERPVAQQVAARMGYESSAGLSYDRRFRSECMKELRRRDPGRYRPMDSERKRFLNRIPKWQKHSQIVALLDMAHDLGVEVDHDVPLKGIDRRDGSHIICGLNVMSNLKLVSPRANRQKWAWFECGRDALIGVPKAS